MLIIVIMIGVVLADQLVKQYILSTLQLGERIPFIPHIMQLTYAQNTGVAFGFLSDHQWIFLVLNPIIIIMLIFIIAKNMFQDKVINIALAAVIGGAIGNMIDRFRHGFVVDMFEFTFVRFAIFNVADIFITLGGMIFIIAFIRKEFNKAKQLKRHG